MLQSRTRIHSSIKLRSEFGSLRQGSHKKNLVAPPKLSGHIFLYFFFEFKKTDFFLVVRSLPLSPLSGPTTKKNRLNGEIAKCARVP